MKMRLLCRILTALLAFSAAFGWSLGAHAQGAEKIKVALHWNTPAHQFLQYYAAIKLGYYKAQNLDVELLPLAGSIPAVVSVSVGDAQIGQASSDAILVSFASGAHLKAVFLFYQQSPNGAIVLKNSGVKSFADMRGKTVATSVASPEGIMLNARLRELGMDPEKDIHILNVAPGAKLTMQLTGQADVSTGLVDFQYIQAQMQGREVDFLPFSTEAAPLYGHAIFGNADWLATHQDATRRFLAATVQGMIWAHDNIDKAVEMVVQWDPSVKVPAEFTRRGWEVNLNDLVRNKRTAREGIGRMEATGWANLVRVLKDGGMLKSDVDPATVFTNDYIPPDVPKW